MTMTATFNSFALGEWLAHEDMDFAYSRDIVNDQVIRMNGIETRNLGGGQFEFSLTIAKSDFNDQLEKLTWLQDLPAALGNAKASLVIDRDGNTKEFPNLLCTGYAMDRNEKTYVKLRVTFIGTAF